MNELVIIDSSNSWIRLDKFLEEPPKTSRVERGNNILHFNTSIRKYQRNDSAKEFVETILAPQGAVGLSSDSEILQFAVAEAKKRNSHVNGLFLEFGFCTGRSLNFIAALAYEKTVFGFDSLEGLPNFWRPGFDKGTFRFKQFSDNTDTVQTSQYQSEIKIPFCPLDNTSLVIGEISKTLPIFIKSVMSNKNVDFIHIDTDVYESAKTIYDNLNDYIIPDKTIIVLDEGYNYWETEDSDKDDEWKQHEYRATVEFARKNNYSIKYLAYNVTHQQLVLTFQHLS